MIFSRLSRLCGMYIHQLKVHPWRTQALTTGALMGGGDVIAQVGISQHRWADYDLPRTGRFVGCGVVIFGPSMHLWYSRLDRHIKGSLSKTVLRKLLLDQTLFLPLYLASFLVVMAALRGDSRVDIREHLRRDYMPMLMTSYALWPIVQAASFALVPGKFRVPLINVVALFWNTYLSWKSEHE